MDYLLDLRTIAFIYAAVRLGLAVVFACLWWVQRSYTPARDWALGTLLTAFGLILIGLRGIASPLTTETISSVFILSGSMTFNMGIVRACGYTPKVKYWCLVCVSGISLVYLLDKSASFSYLETLVYHSTLVIFQSTALFHCLIFWYQSKMAKRNKTFLAIAVILSLSVLGITAKVAIEVFSLFPSLSVPAAKIFQLLFSLTLFPVLVMLLFIQSSQKLQHDLSELACHDMLTGAYNRRAFSQFIEKQWAISTRYQQPLSLLLLDIDDFKVFNDEYGHQTGDRALVCVSLIAEGVLRETDVWCRYGGEEFMALLPDTELFKAIACAERLREAIAQNQIKGTKRTLSVSIGVAQRTSDINNWDELLLICDVALYEAKAAGKNCVRTGTASTLSNTSSPLV
ncbi:diguanylate cyclase (GGDEF) domain-containing protein [Aeromonas sp. RU39B]|uniref:GGDEF domain-containing protein n=1 Tax=Aeromonas sp. RU39B TaxID=1907416 RepID=UPI000953C99F|nr:GGDEF domain-containing protein [Aeromonas sp. RU39B]SIR37454.1 diguanylate cyclase (GGDEF) domain-containing protein [Aeromonas sp. RU39B]